MRRIYFDRIVVDPEIMTGKPVFKGTRIPLYIIMDLIGDGILEEEIIKIYPDLAIEDINSAMKFASNGSSLSFPGNVVSLHLVKQRSTRNIQLLRRLFIIPPHRIEFGH